MCCIQLLWLVAHSFLYLRLSVIVIQCEKSLKRPVERVKGAEWEENKRKNEWVRGRRGRHRGAKYPKRVHLCWDCGPTHNRFENTKTLFKTRRRCAKRRLNDKLPVYSMKREVKNKSTKLAVLDHDDARWRVVVVTKKWRKKKRRYIRKNMKTTV